jgi:O-antigen ligase
MGTIVSNDMEGTWDSGSKKAREELLKISLQFIVLHPFVGIGPGNFASVSGSWRVAHNSYTELGAEAGLPALLMFVTLLIRARINLKRVSRSAVYKENVELQVLTGAMWASYAAYVVGAAFSQTQYHLFPYFLVAYTTVLHYLACVLPSEAEIAIKRHKKEGGEPSPMQAGFSKRAWSYHTSYVNFEGMP